MDIEQMASYLHDNAHAGKAKLLREIGITRRQFQVYGMRMGFRDGTVMSFGQIADHFRISDSAARKSFVAAEEKVRSYMREDMRPDGELTLPH